jgi:hypothetical protein
LAADMSQLIDALQSALSKIESAFLALSPLMTPEDQTFGEAASVFLDKHSRHGRHRPAFCHDIEWVVALRNAWGLGFSHPPSAEKVDES